MAADDRVKRIFAEAIDLAPADRAAFLVRSCAGDSALRSRVQRLLAAHESDSAFMVQAASQSKTVGAIGDKPGERPGEGPGDTIGPYKLLQVIGEGGFGTVYMAEQEQPIRRRVALKVIKLGMDTRAVIARFEAERQALAMMDHPNIAHVLDAGATESGRPYFVMELVKGDPVTAYCDRNTLTIDERLDLFVQICRAVQHAHTKGVIHRDIKPSNILVSTQDGKPHAKVIDFGIAKATSSRLTEKTLFTEFRQFIGTPEYMSPEQAEGSLDVDTRTDVYSLGVLLYELLIGATPFDSRRLRSAAYDELRRIIREDEPERPSTRLSHSDTLTSIAARRRIEPARLGTAVRGDLDWIVMKCLEKDRSRRYETAESLAADLARHLAGQAVLAAPPSGAYRLRKFVRRHRGSVVAAGAIALALTAGAGLAVAGYISAVSARDAEEQERRRADLARDAAQDSEAAALASADRATREAAKLEAINDFFQELLQGVDPENARTNRNVTVREMVDKSAAGLDAGRLKDQPEIEAVVRGTIGQLYHSLGDPAEARRHLVRAIELGEAGALSRGDLAALRGEIGRVFRDLDDPDAAETAYLKALEDAAADGQETTQTLAGLYNNLGGLALSRGQHDKAEELFLRAKAMLEALGGADDRQALQVNWNLAVLAAERGDLARAEALIKEVTDRGVSTFTEYDPLAAGALRNLAVSIANQGRFRESVPIAQRSVDAFRAIVGDRHPETLDALKMLGDISHAGGEHAVSEAAYREVIQARREMPEEMRGDMIPVIRDHANSLEALGRPAEAEAIRREAVEIVRAEGRPPADLATVLGNLGFNLVEQHRYAEAEPLLREALEIRKGLFTDQHPRFWSRMNTQSLLGDSVLGQAEAAAPSDAPRAAELFIQAEALIIPAAEHLTDNEAIPSIYPGQIDIRASAAARAARLYRSWSILTGDPELAAKADAWQQRHDARIAARKAAEREPVPPQ
jgi:serine/threonine protein kinase